MEKFATWKPHENHTKIIQFQCINHKIRLCEFHVVRKIAVKIEVRNQSRVKSAENMFFKGRQHGASVSAWSFERRQHGLWNSLLSLACLESLSLRGTVEPFSSSTILFAHMWSTRVSMSL